MALDPFELIRRGSIGDSSRLMNTRTLFYRPNGMPQTIRVRERCRKGKMHLYSNDTPGPYQ
jgi:hypothetical protein